LFLNYKKEEEERNDLFLIARYTGEEQVEGKLE